MLGTLALVRRFWWLGPILAAGILFALWRGAEAKADRERSGRKAEAAAHESTVAGYRIAAEQATKDAIANAARVEREQSAISERVVYVYREDRAATDTAYERLRAQASAYSSSARTPDLSTAGEAACRAYAGTDCAALPATLKAAQDNTDQLIALQAWAGAQALVATNPETVQ